MPIERWVGGGWDAEATGLLNVYLVDRDDLAVGLLHARQAAHEVPEAAASNSLVLGEQLHAVDLTLLILLRILGGGHIAADDHVLRLPSGQAHVLLLGYVALASHGAESR